MGQHNSTCWTMVAGAARGSSADRDAFCEQYAPLIRRYLGARWRLGAEHEEVVGGCHEVMIQLLKPGGALARVDPAREGGFRAFLYGVVRNVAFMTERSARRRRDVRLESCFDADEIEKSEATLSQVFDRGWVEMLAAQARRLMAQSRDARKQVAYRCLELRYVEGLAPRDIAKEIDRDVREVYELLRSARIAYRRALLDVVAQYHPGESEEHLEQRCRELVQLL